eukprot:6481012-Amphidinium_carterae.2
MMLMTSCQIDSQAIQGLMAVGFLSCTLLPPSFLIGLRDGHFTSYAYTPQPSCLWAASGPLANKLA